MVLPMWLTTLIAGKILYHRHQLIKVMGAESASVYTGVAAIVIESALPFTLISIILLGLFGDNNIAQNLLVSLLVQIEVSTASNLLADSFFVELISPPLSVYRP